MGCFVKYLITILVISVFNIGWFPKLQVEQELPTSSFTETEKANAIVVGSFDISERVPITIDRSKLTKDTETRTRQVYRLRDCNENDKEKICYFAVELSVKQESQNRVSRAAGGWQTVQQCAFTLSSAVGIEVVRLQNNVLIKYGAASGGFARLPAKALTGNLNGTFAAGGAAWNQTSGPTVSPGWNIKVKRGGFLSATASGLLNVWVPIIGLPIGTWDLSIMLFVDDTHTGCI